MNASRNDESRKRGNSRKNGDIYDYTQLNNDDDDDDDDNNNNNNKIIMRTKTDTQFTYIFFFTYPFSASVQTVQSPI